MKKNVLSFLTGAIAMLPLLDMAAAVYCGMRTFEQIQIDGYQPLE